MQTAFAQEIETLGREDLIPEVSYKDNVLSTYSDKGSIHVDIIFGTKENPIAIFELKTGTAVLQQTRIEQLQSHRPNPEISIIEVKP